jgi:hypothetical protein
MIKGLTDRNLSFPEIGAIRKGAPKSERGTVGRDLKYFRVEFDEQETEAAKVFVAAYGHEPAEINILLPFNEIDRMWDAWLESYTAGRMIARSDGEYFIYLVDKTTGETLVKNGFDRSGRKVAHKDMEGLKPVGRLKVVLPELARMAYVCVHTTSIHDIANISSQLEALRQMNNGRLAGIPLKLRRRPKQVSSPVNGKRVRVEKWLISIEADPEWVKRMLVETKRLALPGNGLALLTEGTPQTDQDDDVVDEWEEDEDEAQPEPEQKQEAQPENDDVRNWNIETVEYIAGWTKKKQADIVQVLDLSKELNGMEAQKVISDWISLYINTRKDGSQPAGAASTADQWLVAERDKFNAEQGQNTLL